MMRMLNMDELRQVGGGYLLDDNDTLLWIYLCELSPEKRERVIDKKMMAQSITLFAAFGALGAMAITELITDSSAMLSASAVLGALVGSSLGYSFAKWTTSF